MPRSARKESGCGIYHVMMRGVNRQAIFDDDEDCRRFMDILADLPFQHEDDGRLLRSLCRREWARAASCSAAISSAR